MYVSIDIHMYSCSTICFMYTPAGNYVMEGNFSSIEFSFFSVETVFSNRDGNGRNACMYEFIAQDTKFAAFL